MNIFTKKIMEILGCNAEFALEVQNEIDSWYPIDYSEISDAAFKRTVYIALKSLVADSVVA
jgi:hypothetical protein